MNNTESTAGTDSAGLSIGFLLLQGMAAVYNRDAYKQDIVYEFHFRETAETFQLQICRDECRVTAEDFKHYTVRLDTSLKHLQELTAAAPQNTAALAEDGYSIDGDRSALLELPLLFPSRSRPQQPDTTDNNRRGTGFILHAPLFALWLGILFHQFWGAILVLLVAFFAIKIFIKSRLQVFNYLTVAAGVIAGLISIVYGNSTAVFSLTCIVLGALWGISCFSRSPVIMPYLQEMFDTVKLPQSTSLQSGRVISAIWTAAYLILGVLVYVYRADYDNTDLIGGAIILFAVIWFITRHIMTLYYKTEYKGGSHTHGHHHSDPR